MSQENNIKRRNNELRPITLTYNMFSNADASVLLELGNTKVLCAITMQMGVPHFLRGKGVGWLSAEYAMLPSATPVRTQREHTSASRAGRSVEISRLIGRVLRTVVDCNSFGERTIYVDCDVLQADGGTRVACITAASLALSRVQQVWLSKKFISAPILKDEVAGVAIGIKGSEILVDPDYAEDSSIDADFNVITTRTGKLIEVHGGAERLPIEWSMFDEVRAYATRATNELFAMLYQQEHRSFGDGSIVPQGGRLDVAQARQSSVSSSNNKQELPLFSLKNRLSIKHNV